MSAETRDDREELLTAGEVAQRLGVAPSTVPCVRTAGGHRRFVLRDVERLQSRLGRGGVGRWADDALADPDAAAS